MLYLKDASEIVSKEIEEVSVNCFPEQPQLLYDPMKYILSLGGKRIRPSLALMSHSLFSDKMNDIIMPAIGLEVFHNFTLVHDDIMDKSFLRRGKDTVHVKWNENVGILSGDAMMIKAYEFICKAKDEYFRDVLNLFNKTALEVCEGQQMDMDFEHRTDVSDVEYLEMIKLKTAVLIAASLKLGAIIGGADSKDSSSLYDIGYDIGMAFQLQDDLLDTFGNQEVFGKPIGGDIINDKKTYLLIKAYELADNNQIDILNKWQGVNDPDKNNLKVNAIKSIYEELKVKEIVKQLINNYFENAYNRLDSLSINKDKLLGIYCFVDKLKNREK